MTGVIIRRDQDKGTHNGKTMQRQGKDGCAQAKRGKSQPCPHLDLGLLAPRIGRKLISVLETPSLCCQVMVALAKENRGAELIVFSK